MQPEFEYTIEVKMVRHMKIIKIYKGKIQTWIQAHLCTYIIQNKHLIFIESVSKYNPLETLTQVILFYFIINKHMKALRSLGISISCFLCLLYNRRHLVYNHQFFGALLKNIWLCILGISQSTFTCIISLVLLTLK